MKIKYLGRQWELIAKHPMYDKYDGWTEFSFKLLNKHEHGYLLDDDINYENGTFNKLSEDTHVAIELGSMDPEGTNKFNHLVVAAKNSDPMRLQLPPWNNEKFNDRSIGVERKKELLEQYLEADFDAGEVPMNKWDAEFLETVDDMVKGIRR